MRRIIYDGDSFYELDEDCVRQKAQTQKQEKPGNWKHSRMEKQRTHLDVLEKNSEKSKGFQKRQKN